MVRYRDKRPCSVKRSLWLSLRAETLAGEEESTGEPCRGGRLERPGVNPRGGSLCNEAVHPPERLPPLSSICCGVFLRAAARLSGCTQRWLRYGLDMVYRAAYEALLIQLVHWIVPPRLGCCKGWSMSSSIKPKKSPPKPAWFDAGCRSRKLTSSTALILFPCARGA